MTMETNRKLYIGIILMIVSSFCTCFGQMLWKIAVNSNLVLLLYFIGLFLYGIGACLMVIAFGYGQMSILHPMLSAGYVLSLFIGYFFLDEKITLKAIVGVTLIIIGMIFLGVSAKDNQNGNCD